MPLSLSACRLTLSIPLFLQVLLDENFMEYTEGQPLPMQDLGKVGWGHLLSRRLCSFLERAFVGCYWSVSVLFLPVSLSASLAITRTFPPLFCTAILLNPFFLRPNRQCGHCTKPSNPVPPLLFFFSPQAVFHTAILNDTLFLNIVNIVDYSIVVGLDEDRRELVRRLLQEFSLANLGTSPLKGL